LYVTERDFGSTHVGLIQHDRVIQDFLDDAKVMGPSFNLHARSDLCCFAPELREIVQLSERPVDARRGNFEDIRIQPDRRLRVQVIAQNAGDAGTIPVSHASRFLVDVDTQDRATRLTGDLECVIRASRSRDIS
jgi:hypothetical protein